MIIAFLALSIIPFLIAGLVGISTNLKSLHQISIENLNNSLSVMQSKLDMFFHSIEENVYFFTSSNTFNRYINAINKEDNPEVKNTTLEIMPEIMSFTHNKEYFHQIKLINSYGDELFCLEKQDNNYHFFNDDELNQSGTQFYLYVAQNIPPNTATFLPTEIKKNENKELIPTVSCIFHVRNSNFFGALVFHIYAESFFNILTQERSKIQGTKVMLVNKDGYYLYHSDKKTDWNQLSASKDILNLKTDFGIETSEEILTDTSGFILEIGNNIIGQTKVFTSDFGLNNEYTLILSVLKKDIFKPVNRHKLIFGSLMILFILSSFILALVATHQFIDPINRLISETKIISGGNYNSNVDIKTYDEIEELAGQFNLMAESLNKREHEINRHKELLEQTVRERTQDLENEKNKLQTIFDNVPIGFILMNNDNIIISASAATEKITGKIPQNIIGKNYFSQFKWNNASRKLKILEIKKNQKLFTEQVSFKKDDGSMQYQEHIVVLLAREKQENNILEIITNITERKRLQDMLLHSERLAATGRIAAIIAHEMRNSLTSVNMILQLLSRKDGLSVSDTDSFRVALNSVNHIENVVNDLLHLASPSKLEKRFEDINNVINEGIQFSLHQIQKKGVNLILNLAENMPGILIDPGRIKEVIINLLLNALQAVEDDGEITIKTENKKLDREIWQWEEVKTDIQINSELNIHEIIIKKGQEIIQVDISDNGPGIDAKYFNRIFEPFFTTKLSGTGIGLSIVKKIINQHGSIIQVNSKKNMGSTFSLIFPVQ